MARIAGVLGREVMRAFPRVLETNPGVIRTLFPVVQATFVEGYCVMIPFSGSLNEKDLTGIFPVLGMAVFGDHFVSPLLYRCFSLLHRHLLRAFRDHPESSRIQPLVWMVIWFRTHIKIPARKKNS
jgi:hypothetical protein